MGYYGMGPGGGGGAATYINKSATFSYVAKKDTISGSYDFAGKGYMSKTLNGSKSVYSSVSATFSVLDATYCLLANIPMDLETGIRLKADFCAFEMVKYGTGAGTIARFAYSQSLSALVLRDTDGYHIIGSTTSQYMWNDLAAYSPACGITVSSSSLFLYGKQAGGYDALLGTVAEEMIPNMKWNVSYEYSIVSHPTNTQYYT